MFHHSANTHRLKRVTRSNEQEEVYDFFVLYHWLYILLSIPAYEMQGWSRFASLCPLFFLISSGHGGKNPLIET